MARYLARLAAAAFLWFVPLVVLAAPPTTITDPTNTYNMKVDGSGAHFVCDSGCNGGGGGGGSSGGAGSLPFIPTSSTSNATLSVTTTTANVALPAGAQDLITNTGTQAVYIALGVGAGTTATTSGFYIAAGGSVMLTVGSNTYIAAITATGTSSLQIAGGALAATPVSAAAGAFGDLNPGGNAYGAITGPVPACVITSSCNWMGNPVPFSNMTTAAYVSVTGTATLVSAARTGALGTGRGLIVVETTGTAVINCGGSGVTTTSGTRLPAVDGASFTFPDQVAVYCISTGATTSVSVTELY